MDSLEQIIRIITGRKTLPYGSGVFFWGAVMVVFWIAVLLTLFL